MTTINNQYPALTSSRKGIFFQTEYFAGNQIASQNNVGYNIVPRNYFTYRHMSDDEIFHFNINDICDFGIVSTLYPVFTTKKELDSKYLQYQLNYGKEFAKFASLQKQGGSRTYMYFAKLKELVLTMPKVEEQTKISSILSNIDNLITLHQRKCTYIFYSWEQRKFENIFNYERPDKYIVNSTKYLEFGPTPVLTANKAFILGYTTEKNKYVNSHESIIFDDFTLDTKFVDFPYMVKSSAIKILTLKDEKKDNIRFNFELLSNHRFNMLGHARHYISVVQPEEVFTTNKQEQNKIGELFTNLDNLITLHQHKELKRRNDNNDNLRW